MDLNPQHLEKKYNSEVASVVKKAGDLLRSKYGLWFLGIFAAADSALALPLSTDPFMIAYMLANRAKAWVGYIITVCASVLGGVVAYFLAAFVSEQLLAVGETSSLFTTLVATFEQHVFLISFIGAFSPFPYTLLSFTAGALKVNLFLFIMGSLAGRALRYGIVAYVAYFFGERAVEMAKRHLLVSSGVVLVLVAVYILVVLYLKM